MEALKAKLDAVAKLNAATYNTVLQKSNGPPLLPLTAAADVSIGVDLSTRPSVTDGHMLNAPLERTKGDAMRSGLPVKQVKPAARTGQTVAKSKARPQPFPISSESAQAATSPERLASSVVTARLREHPNNKNKPVVGSIFSSAAAEVQADNAPTEKRRLSLELSLKQRPTMEELANRNIIPAAAASGTISVPIAEKVQALQRQRTAESLESMLQRRPSADLLASHGILRDQLARTAQAASAQVQAELAELAAAPSIDQLVDDDDDDEIEPEPTPPPGRLLKRSSSVSDTIKQLEKKRLSSSLSAHLETRPPMVTLAEKGIVSEHVASGHVAPALASPADAVAKSLTKRPSIDELAAKGIIKSSPVESRAAPALHSKLAALHKQSTASSLKSALETRLSLGALAEKGIVSEHVASGHVAPALAAPADAVAKSLTKRPSVVELEEKGILPPAWATAPGVAEAMLRNEKIRTAEVVAKGLTRRPSIDELAAKGIIKSADARAAPALHSKLAALHKQSTASSLESALHKRPSIDVLSARGILPDDAPVLKPDPNPLSPPRNYRHVRPTRIDAAIVVEQPKMPSEPYSPEPPSPGVPRSPDALREQEASRKQWLAYYTNTNNWDAALALSRGAEEQTRIATKMSEAYAKAAAAGSINVGDFDDEEEEDDETSAKTTFDKAHMDAVRASMFGDRLEDFEDQEEYEEDETEGASARPPLGRPSDEESDSSDDSSDDDEMEEFADEDEGDSDDDEDAGPHPFSMRAALLDQRAKLEELDVALHIRACNAMAAEREKSSPGIKPAARPAGSPGRSAGEFKIHPSPEPSPGVSPGPSPSKRSIVPPRAVTGSTLEQMATVEELRARGVLPDMLFTSGLADKEVLAASDSRGDQYECDARADDDDYMDRIKITDLGEFGEEDDEDSSSYEEEDEEESYEDDDDDDEAYDDFDIGGEPSHLSVHPDVDISDLAEWLAARGGGVQRSVIEVDGGAADEDYEEDYDPITTPRDDYTERAEPPPMNAANSPTRDTAPEARIKILRSAPASSQPAVAPVDEADEADDDERPLLGSPTSGGGLKGLQASLDEALDGMRVEMNKLLQAKGDGLTETQRKRAKAELDRALGGF